MRLPSSHDLHGSRPEGWAPFGLGWNVRSEGRVRAPCETCGQPAFQDPPCEVRDQAGNLLRVEHKTICLDCSRKERSWKRERDARRPMPGLKEEPMAIVPVQEIRTCPCECGEPLAPGRTYASRACMGRARKGKPLGPRPRAKTRRMEDIPRATPPVLPASPPACPYVTVATLAREHDARTLRAALILREAIEAICK